VLIDGRTLAAEIRGAAASAVTSCQPPVLALVVASSDAATEWYADSLERQATIVGIATRRVLAKNRETVTRSLDELSSDSTVDAIICLTPLPDGLTLAAAAEHIAPAKDVDGANPTSLGRLAAGLPGYAPATAQAVIELLRHNGIALRGASAVVVGRSTVVGKPAALLLLAEHATVTICHSHTHDLGSVTRQADVLVAAAGQRHLIRAEHVRPGAFVVDVGTNVDHDGTILGDADTAAIEPIAFITPVPGGVGPVTTAVLLRNVITAANDGRRERPTA
jgi:methylenetetrahydrofolate dehydrogenase (NADP+)/methenyltetrahydrofolate cyclohydrolase